VREERGQRGAGLEILGRALEARRRVHEFVQVLEAGSASWADSRSK
jgi:hypothetical protein